MNIIRKITSLLQLTKTLRSQTVSAGRYVGSQRDKLHAMIETYHATNNCTQCKTNPENSFSHRADRVLLASGVTAFFLMVLMGTISHLFFGDDWAGNASIGPRDDFGWRRGGIFSLMGRFERGGW